MGGRENEDVPLKERTSVLRRELDAIEQRIKNLESGANETP
jgi:hypothetical protein